MRRRSFKARLCGLEQQLRSGHSHRPLSLVPEWPESGPVGDAVDGAWQYAALPAQRKFHSDGESRFKGFSGPIGSGKSYALAYEAIFLSRQNPGLLGLVGAPTYPMLRDSTQRTFFEVLDTEGIPYTFHKQENKLKFLSNGSEVIFRSLENPDRLRGPNLA